MNTGKEGKGQAVHEELELHQSHGALLTRRILVSFHVEAGSFRDWLHAGWKFTPPEGSHTSAVLPKTAVCCQTSVPLLLPSSSCFSQGGCQCFPTAEMNSSCGEVPCRMRGPEEPLQGHRSQAHALFTSAGSSYFTSLSAGAAAGCVGRRQ